MNDMSSIKEEVLPLSHNQRRFYFLSLFTVFIIAVPFLFLYATGYRFAGFNDLVKTGGLYVSAERASAEIYIDGTLVRETGTFRRAFFIQNLEPKAYTLEVQKEGHHSWGKTLPVYAHFVTEAHAFNLPKEPSFQRIPATLEPESATNTTDRVANPLYEEIVTAFETITATSTLSMSRSEGDTSSASFEGTATTTKYFRGMVLSESGRAIIATWVDDTANSPFYFCVPKEGCIKEVLINTKGEKPLYFDFFPGGTDLVVLTLSDGVYVTEIDNRSGQNIQPILIEKGADFRIISGDIYVLVGDALFLVELSDAR